MSGPLISAISLQDLLDGPTPPVVLDVRYRMGGPGGPEEYAAGHIPRAAYVDLETALAAPPGSGGRHPLPDPEVFVEAMKRAGVGIEGPVVVYDDWSGHAASRAWWLLRHYGHRDVRVLDGGWSAWQAAGGAAETGDPVIDRGDFHGVPGSMPVVDADTVTGVDVLIDARAPERYRGEVEPIDPVAGHIPGAVNVPTARNLDNHGHFRDPGELRAVYGPLLQESDSTVAAYCGSGVTACHDLLALELIGVSAALYPGSWSGWITSARP
jgi:thiosulfate/3-mercaptopyruvate sulfurtransferase